MPKPLAELTVSAKLVKISNKKLAPWKNDGRASRNKLSWEAARADLTPKQKKQQAQAAQGNLRKPTRSCKHSYV
jgi:hypothetical protein